MNIMYENTIYHMASKNYRVKHSSSNSTLSATLIKENSHKLRNGKVYYGSQHFVLGSLHVDPKLRNKGIGSILLNRLIEYAKKNNVDKIVLDDMTDNYRKRNNIYLKHEFRYLSNNGPEMEYIVEHDNPFEQ